MYTCCIFDIYIANKIQHYNIHAQCISIIYIYNPMTAESPKNERWDVPCAMGTPR
jgi:hypothetical protein